MWRVCVNIKCVCGDVVSVSLTGGVDILCEYLNVCVSVSVVGVRQTGLWADCFNM